MRGHIDPGTLAAYRERLLSRRRAARVAAHLSGCPQCAETDAQLAGVATILASTPVPPMPAGLAGRIEAALAAEAASRAAGEARPAAGAADGSVTGPRPLAGSAAGAARGASGDLPPARPPREHRPRPPRRSWLTLRAAAVTAAVVVVIGGGYGVVQLLSRGTNTSATSSGAASAEHSAARPGAAAGGANRLAPSSGLALGPTVVRSGTNYQPQRLTSQAKAVLDSHSQPEPRPARAAKRLPPSYGNAIADLPACVQRVTGGHALKLVDLARFQGQQAAVIMLPAAQSQVRVVVVGPGCSGAASHVLAQALVPAAG